MAALLHQAALQPPTHTPKHLSWPRPDRSPCHASPRNRRRAPTRLQASGRAVGSPVTDKKSTKAHSKKRSRKERRQQLVPVETAVRDGGGEGEDDVDDDEIPQAVFDRMLRRILFAVGIPMASGVGLLNAYDTVKRAHGVAVPAWLPLLTILLAFGTSALGIAYGTLSASWDPEKEGSLLGLEEVRTNWPELWKDELADKK